jgi:predicted MFS family arabinose efflux permease
MLTRFVPQLRTNITNLLLVDMALTFNCTTGVMNQITTVAASFTVVVAIVLGALSARFRAKSLLLAGLSLLAVSSIGCFFATDYPSMVLLYSLGLGAAITGPMASTLIGEHFPVEQRTRAMGLTSGVGQTLPYLIGAPLVAVLTGIGGWRLPFVVLAAPIAILTLILAYKSIPSQPVYATSGAGIRRYLAGFAGVLRQRSAVYCLIGLALSNGAWQFYMQYSPTFTRQILQMPLAYTSLILIAIALMGLVGSLLASRVVNKVGRKPATIATILVTVAFVGAFYTTTLLWLAISLSLVGCLFTGIRLISQRSLALEQIPRFRGTMMALTVAALQMGRVIAGIGGLILDAFSYAGLGVVSIAIGIVAAVTFQRFVVDPTRS